MVIYHLVLVWEGQFPRVNEHAWFGWGDCSHKALLDLLHRT